VHDEPPTGDPDTSTPLGTWGPLHLIEEVGRGGFGVVYRAWEPVLAREVALKVIRPREARPDAIRAVLREGQLLARIRHANVVTIHGAQQIGDEIGLWMEFVRGRSLAELVDAEGPRAAGEAGVIAMALCQALAAVHRAGVVHRDVKARNVMREAGGRIVLMDFGAGQALEPVTTGSAVMGTPAYMAPEVLLGQPASVLSDVYSVGVLLFFLVTGTYPVTGRTFGDCLLAHTTGDRKRLGDVRPDVEPEFVRLVERAMAPSPSDRFPTAGALLAALAGTTPAAPILVQPPAPPAHVARSLETVTVDRRLVLAGAVFLCVGVLGAVASVAFNHTLGRSGEFQTESVMAWWIWGARALLPGAVHVVIVLLGVWALRAAWHIVSRLVPPARRVAERSSVSVALALTRAGMNEPAMLAQVLLVLQVAAIAAFCWHFSDILSAVASFVESAPPEALDPLRPDRLFRHQMYNYVMAMQILASAMGLVLLHRLARLRGDRPSHAPFRANYAAIVVSLVILVLPYRLLWQNELEVSTYQGMRCYLLATSGSAHLVYCPMADPPRSRRVPLTDPALVRTGVFENLYTRPATSLP
jgi:predicted Ser/Thr protein kinase